MKHTEVTQNYDWTQLDWCDQLVFAQIKRFMDWRTRTCYPSLDTLHKLTKMSVRFISSSIKRLEDAGLITIIRKQGASNVYKFPPETDQFEKFSEEFLDMDLEPRAKEYYMKLQGYLFNKDDKVAVLTYSDLEISQKLGLNIKTVKKYNQILIDSGYITTKETTEKNEAGLAIRKMCFDMEKLGQFGLWAKAITNQTLKNSEDIETLKAEIEKLKSMITPEKKVINLIIDGEGVSMD